jgi:hypothetical protein
VYIWCILVAFHKAIVCPIPRPYETVVIFLNKKDNQEFKGEFGFGLNSLGSYEKRYQRE